MHVNTCSIASLVWLVLAPLPNAEHQTKDELKPILESLRYDLDHGSNLKPANLKADTLPTEALEPVKGCIKKIFRKQFLLNQKYVADTHSMYFPH